ncbi:TPA: nucleoside-diphosphate kinase [Candidatus Dependentiae bacterium]|nr:MAG: Nucleoside diphosphate kinase [candidate division TM6 bacterium GW2011_GWE2_31_21]KKP53939.1 MAG: Nucleoside diphosphate kinase [candidate division TM6 bacterium GW2011_GWF2_33_332]HBS47719.1 nucleoside-diphosphate kinase [Candidatus Dependentiae bacterium]HBZ73868.1 nucleoside-diphosphate kinase [Candidatus Dependentiae bacterium]
MTERTLALIKPDGVVKKYSGKIIDRIEHEGFTIINLKKLQLTKEQGEAFYAVHREKPFFGELVEYITSGPIIAIALEKDNAVLAWRNLMGATNPEKAEPNSIRKLYGTSLNSNATHGSDSIENGQKEIAFFFPNLK